MPVNFNTKILPELPAALAEAQRALFYADGLFETLRVFDGRMPLLHRHWSRLFAGGQALGYDLPPAWNANFFEREINEVATQNARVRLTVWRSPGGLYFPENNAPQFLITAEPLKKSVFEWPFEGLTLGICESVQLPLDAFSNFKTLNAARYVAAAREARARGWDDGLLLNPLGRVVEATSSNVFWWEGDTLFSPPLGEGCVAGVMRGWLLEQSEKEGISCHEIAVTPEELSAADEIFLTNAVRGIVPVRIFAGRELGHARTRELFDSVFFKF